MLLCHGSQDSLETRTRVRDAVSADAIILGVHRLSSRTNCNNDRTLVICYTQASLLDRPVLVGTKTWLHQHFAESGVTRHDIFQLGCQALRILEDHDRSSVP